MKKILSLALVVILLLSVSTPIPVSAANDEMFAVNIEWTDLSFNYNGVYTWNPETHAYDIPDEANSSWSSNGTQRIHIENMPHSSAIEVEVSYTPAQAYENTQMYFSEAWGGDSDYDFVEATIYEGQHYKWTLSMSGTMSAQQGTNIPIGTITIKISPAT